MQSCLLGSVWAEIKLVQFSQRLGLYGASKAIRHVVFGDALKRAVFSLNGGLFNSDSHEAPVQQKLALVHRV